MARTLSEVNRFSADVYSYATAFSLQPLWGDVMQAFPKPEGELFPGLVPVVLALVGVLFFRLKPEATDPRVSSCGPRAVTASGRTDVASAFRRREPRHHDGGGSP